MTIKRRVSANSSSNRRKRLVGTPSCSNTIVLPSEIKEEELAWKNELPPGVKFVPSQEDFIYYLLKKVYTGSIDFGGVIRDIDLYKYEPENLKDLAFEGESRLYFFTPLQKRYANGTRNKRETVNGFWKGTQTTKTILDSDNKHVVTKTPFSYYHPRGKNAKKTQWLMDEYKLSDHDDNHHVMLKNWALCVVHYKKRGGNGNNDEKEDDKSSDTKKSSSTGSRFEAMRSTSQTSMIGSASEYALTVKSGQTPTPFKHNTISFGNSNSSVGSSTSQPQPNWSCNINPKKRQCSISDQPLLTRPNFNIASHDQGHPSQSQFPKSTPCGTGIVSPNCDQTQFLDFSLADRLNLHSSNMISDLSLNNNVSGDQMLPDFDFDDSIFSEYLYTILHDEIPHSALPQQRDDDTKKMNPSMNPTVTASSSPFPPTS